MNTSEQVDTFADWCRKNGWTQKRLAEECLTGRAQLNQILSGRRCGRHTWKRIVKILPMEAVLLLKQGSAWNGFAQDALEARQEREYLADLARKCAAQIKSQGGVS